MAIEEFNNKERLKKIREESLNPLISKVTKNIDPRLDTAEDKISSSYNEVHLDQSTKSLEFHTHGGHLSTFIPLGNIIPDEFPGVSVIGTTGGETNLKTITFKDSTVTSNGANGARVAYDWKNIVEGNQREVYGRVGGSSPEAIRTFQYSGDTTKIDIRSGIATLTIPKADPITAQVKGTKGEIKNIIIAGDTDGCTVDNEILTINLKAGGGGTPLSAGNFVGFFENLGDLESEVTAPINGKSMAFVKDKTFTTKTYYDAYMYVNGSWTEVPNDPGVTYEDPNVAGKQGVFSIKPSPYISIDSTGQMNLDRLAESSGFAGFFESQHALDIAVPNPIPDVSYGYIRQAVGSWLGKRFTHNTQTGVREWANTVPFGATAVVTKSATGPDVTVVSYGFLDNGMISIDHSSGLATINPGTGGTTLPVSVSNHDGSSIETHPVKGIRYANSSSMVGFEGVTKEELVLTHPQRVINYTGAWELAHNTQDYKGNIFYDDNSRCWMGWSTPAAPGAVGAKWTRIAHEDMSLEVKDLVKRVPAKAPVVTAGITGDDSQWEGSGWSYVDPVGESDVSSLPDEIKQIGAYVHTYVKDVPGESGVPQTRMQTCYEDGEGSSQWVRRLDQNPGTGNPSWKKWVRTSFSNADIEKHSRDPNCHKDVIKFHKTTALGGVIQNINNQTLDGVRGCLRTDNYYILSDNYGFLKDLQDYGSVPYDNGFSGTGVIELSGYGTGDIPLCKWTVEVRIMRKGSFVTAPLLKQSYVHTATTRKYPPMRFELPRTELNRDDKLYVFFYSDNATAIKNKHPNLYIAPVRSYVSLQDANTSAGSAIGRNFRKLLSGVDIEGDFGVKVHLRDPSDPKSAIRVYGAKITKTPVDMQTTP
ncbi:MAG: hypothetical protein ACRC6V_08915 [Bacteroidales bacterium]